MDLVIYYRIMEHTHKLLKCNLTFQLVERNMYYLLFRLHSSADFNLVKLIQNNAKKIRPCALSEELSTYYHKNTMIMKQN